MPRLLHATEEGCLLRVQRAKVHLIKLKNDWTISFADLMDQQIAEANKDFAGREPNPILAVRRPADKTDRLL